MGYPDKMNLIRVIAEIAGTPCYRKSPMASIRYLYARWIFRRFRIGDPFEFLAKMGIDPQAAMQGFDRWREILEAAQTRIERGSGEQGGIGWKDGVILFGLARAIQPEYVVETGVAAGMSTSFLGAALIENGCGRLYSIELPVTATDELSLSDGSHYTWQERGVGWAVPESIRSELAGRHTLVLRDVREALPEVLSQIPHVDLFFHDDLHTPGHMLWEYERVWRKLRPGGVLLSDDVNYGWLQFCEREKIRGTSLNNVDRLCALRRPFALATAKPAMGEKQ